jgi:AbrB family looped-hinge helix DNA binding protein
MRRIVRMLRHGQVTIPKEIRQAAGMSEGGMLSVELVDGKVQVESVDARPRRADWVKDLYDLFEPVREALKDVPEQEINEAIDEAVEEIRARKR